MSYEKENKSDFRLVIGETNSVEQARDLVNRLVAAGFDRDQISISRQKGLPDIDPSGSNPLDPARFSGTLSGTLGASGNLLVGNSATVDTVAVDFEELLSRAAKEDELLDSAEQKTGLYVGLRGLSPGDASRAETIFRESGAGMTTNVHDTGFQGLVR